MTGNHPSATFQSAAAKSSFGSDRADQSTKNFASGNYDTAVRDAFVEVEIAVRAADQLPASLVVVKLMREAFNSNTGKLTDQALPMSERERVADLFAGAIGTFKNPLSHRKVGNSEPMLVMEELLFASLWLRFVK